MSDPALRLSEQLAQLSTAVLSEQTLDQLLASLLTLTRATVPGADGVSVSVPADGGFATASATDDVVRELDGVQYGDRSGPCVEAITSGETVNASLAAEPHRYPRFCAAAQQRFMTGVLSTPLRTGDHVVGALNCYSATVDRFGPDGADVAATFARHAAVLLGNAATLASAASTNEQLHQALQSRDLIGQAKGILMERSRCSADEAFDVLRRASQRRNRKLTAVAADVVAGRDPGVGAEGPA